MEDKAIHIAETLTATAMQTGKIGCSPDTVCKYFAAVLERINIVLGNSQDTTPKEVVFSWLGEKPNDQ